MKVINALLVVIITIFLVKDFFPEWNGLAFIPSWTVLPIVLITYLMSNLPGSTEEDERDDGKMDIFLVLYLFVLIGVLAMLGGNSENGITSSFVFWIVVGISVFHIFRKQRTRKRT
ncbi:hypothetical protein ACFOGI_00330 [Virgibacillus xinjiangensis]|uniref:Uncharacterized protein n=1 Tax=Virgibacillus xinjiangensis TaxID=393090 RepID=A0ABV7CQX4_9BACI